MKRLALLLALVGCKKEDRQLIDAPKAIDAKQIDAKVIDGPTIDAPMADAGVDAPQFVMTVACTGTHPIIRTDALTLVFMPDMATINQNEMVEFQMSANHSVEPDATNSDPGLAVGFGETKCLMFTATGTFGFHCNPHFFTGSIVVN